MSDRLSRRRLLAGIVLVAAAGIVAFVLLSGDDDSSGNGDDSRSNPPVTGRPEAASLDRLRGIAELVGHPVYWAGQQSGRRYELTVESDGKVYVRYLDPGVRIGSRKVASLTIGTYPYIGALGALRALARQPGAISDHAPDGGLVVATGASPTNVYLGYPGSDLQIEVYDPHAGSALALARGGAIVPIG